jgi:hypothetical protein
VWEKMEGDEGQRKANPGRGKRGKRSPPKKNIRGHNHDLPERNKIPPSREQQQQKLTRHR